MKRFFVMFFALLFLLCFQTSTVFSDQEVEKQPLTFDFSEAATLTNQDFKFDLEGFKADLEDPGRLSSKPDYANKNSCGSCHNGIVPKIRLPVCVYIVAH